MERRDITVITSNLIKTLKGYGEKAVADLDMKSIHQFRVIYKRFRAFLRMLECDILANHKIKMSGQIKAAYMAAGRLRDLQLHQVHNGETAKKNKRGRLTANRYTHETERAKQFFVKTFHEINFSKAAKKIFTSVPAEYSSASFILFIKNKWEAVNRIVVSGRFSDADIHRIRKNLKDLFYNLELFTGEEYSVFCRLACKNKKISYFEKLLKQLGNFQDKCVAIGLSKVYNKKLYTGTAGKWKKEKENSKQIIIAGLKAVPGT